MQNFSYLMLFEAAKKERVFEVGNTPLLGLPTNSLSLPRWKDIFPPVLDQQADVLESKSSPNFNAERDFDGAD